MTAIQSGPAARDDPITREYEQIITGVRGVHHADVAAAAVELLGVPPLRSRPSVVDLGCGPGVVSAGFRPRWDVIGVDVWAGQLSLARVGRRVDVLLLADAARVSSLDSRADAVVSTYTRTDVGDWPALVAGAARLEASGRPMAHVGPASLFRRPTRRARRGHRRPPSEAHRYRSGQMVSGGRGCPAAGRPLSSASYRAPARSGGSRRPVAQARAR